MVREREKNTTFYTQEIVRIDCMTGEILSAEEKTVTKTAGEPDYIKIYYETMMAFNQIHDIPISFVVAASSFIEWTNEGKPIYITLNKRIKQEMSESCGVDVRQIERYIKKAVETGLFFRTVYRGVYEVNPFMIAKGRWESVKKLRASFDFVNGKWERIAEITTSPGKEQ